MIATLAIATMLGTPPAEPRWTIGADGSLVEVAAEPDPLPEIIIEEPPPARTATRTPGPRHAMPHSGCAMCAGNHLIQPHGHDQSELDGIGSGRWAVQHDNDHNRPGFEHGGQPRGNGAYGYRTSPRPAWRVKPRRWRRR